MKKPGYLSVGLLLLRRAWKIKEGNLYIVATMVDTTDIRRNELELDDIRRELSVALDAGSLSAWCYDVQKDTFTSLYRKTLANDGLSNKGALDLLHPDDKENTVGLCPACPGE